MRSIHALAAILCVLALQPMPSARAQSWKTIYATNVFVETIAGSEFKGHIDGQGTETMFDWARAVDFHPDGSLIVGEWGAPGPTHLRRVSDSFLVSTLSFKGPMADSLQGMYVLDLAVSPAGRIAMLLFERYLFAANEGGEAENLGLQNSLPSPSGIAYESDGSLVVADSVRNAVFRIGRDGVTSRIAGSGNAGQIDGKGLFSSFWEPSRLALDHAGTIFVVDGHPNSIRRITTDARVSTLVPIRLNVADDGPSGMAAVQEVNAIVCDRDGGLIIADGYRVRRVAPDGSIVTIAGSHTESGYVDGEGSKARFNAVRGLAVDSQNRIYLSDGTRIRRISYGRLPVVEDLSIGMFAGIRINGPVGSRFRVEYSGDVGDGKTWTVAETLTLEAESRVWFDPESDAKSRRFYRAVRVP